MWNDFSDFELAQLAGTYGLQDYVDFNDQLRLSNREHLEAILTEYEYALAWGVPEGIDFNSEVAYN